MIGCMDLVVFVPFVRDQIAKSMSFVIQDAPRETVQVLLPSVAFLLFVVVSEGWIWIRRFKVRMALVTLYRLGENYTVKKRSR
jgi:hypothetical protein